MADEFLRSVVPNPKGAGEFGLVSPLGAVKSLLGLLVSVVCNLDTGDNFLAGRGVADLGLTRHVGGQVTDKRSEHLDCCFVGRGEEINFWGFRFDET